MGQPNSREYERPPQGGVIYEQPNSNRPVTRPPPQYHKPKPRDSDVMSTSSFSMAPQSLGSSNNSSLSVRGGKLDISCDPSEKHKITSSFMEHLCHAMIIQSGHIKVLKLSGNIIGEAAIAPLSAFVSNSGSLEELHLSHCQLSVRAASQLIWAVCQSKKSVLRLVDVSGNQLDCATARSLAKALASPACPLTELIIRENPITLLGVIELIGNGQNLRKLDCARCFIHPPRHPPLENQEAWTKRVSEFQTNFQTLCSVISNNQSLEDINLEGTNLDDNQKAALQDAARDNVTLRLSAIPQPSQQQPSRPALGGAVNRSKSTDVGGMAAVAWRNRSNPTTPLSTSNGTSRNGWDDRASDVSYDSRREISNNRDYYPSNRPSASSSSSRHYDEIVPMPSSSSSTPQYKPPPPPVTNARPAPPPAATIAPHSPIPDAVPKKKKGIWNKINKKISKLRGDYDKPYAQNNSPTFTPVVNSAYAAPVTPNGTNHNNQQQVPRANDPYANWYDNDSVDEETTPNNTSYRPPPSAAAMERNIPNHNGRNSPPAVASIERYNNHHVSNHGPPSKVPQAPIHNGYYDDDDDDYDDRMYGRDEPVTRYGQNGGQFHNNRYDYDDEYDDGYQPAPMHQQRGPPSTYTRAPPPRNYDNYEEEDDDDDDYDYDDGFVNPSQRSYHNSNGYTTAPYPGFGPTNHGYGANGYGYPTYQHY